MKKKFKLLVEFVSKEETDLGTIGLRESGILMRDIVKVAKKHKMDCYIKGQPAEKLNYVPTGKEYEIKTVEDIAKLTAEQFEFFIDDLRNFCEGRRVLENVNKIVGIDIVKPSKDGFTWLDTGLNEAKYQFETSNKI